MTGYNYLSIIAIGLIVIGGGMRAYAEGDVTIYTPPATTNAPPTMASAPDGTPVVHKSLHKKKKSKAESTATTTTPGTPSVITPTDGTTPPATTTSTATTAAPTKSTAKSASATATATTPAKKGKSSALTKTSAPSPTPTPTVATSIPQVPPQAPAPVAKATPPAPTTSSQLGAILPGDAPAALVPTVETGLPIPRRSSLDTPAEVYRYPDPSYLNRMGSSSPSQSPSYDSSTPGRTTSALDTYSVTNPTKKTRTYPWKRDIITTMFYIGEGGSTISATDNIGSAWDEDWRTNAGGTDSPNDRNDYGPAGHAARVNTFYVALPFNDLAYPDKTRRWLPAGWYRSPRDGKQVSACQHRWVEIKNAQGETCYAQWEDVGPLRSDHAEYVFGSERPDTYTRAGLDVSPAVFKYLNLDGGHNRYTSWRFVEAEDVPPGFWLKYEEQAVLFKAMHDMKSASSNLPIQRSVAPIDDPSNIDSNKKKVGAAKG